MKKIFVFSLMLLGILIFNNNVKAACGYPVIVGDEMLCAASDFVSNKAGTAYIESKKLVLKNYNGGQIRIGPLFDLEIELIGDNYITNENGSGIEKQQSITFTGNGTLTIKSKIPVIDIGINNSIDYTLTNRVETIKIAPNNLETTVEEKQTLDNNQNEEITEERKEESKENVEIKEETSEEDTTIKEEIDANIKGVEISKNDIVLLISLGFSTLCLIIIIILVNKNIKLKKINT